MQWTLQHTGKGSKCCFTDKRVSFTYSYTELVICIELTRVSEVDQALRKISLDDDLTVAAITGTGKYFTSGNDMGDGMKRMMGKLLNYLSYCSWLSLRKRFDARRSLCSKHRNVQIASWHSYRFWKAPCRTCQWTCHWNRCHGPSSCWLCLELRWRDVSNAIYANRSSSRSLFIILASSGSWFCKCKRNASIWHSIYSART